MTKICDLFVFKQRNSLLYYVAANGLAKAFNKILCNLLKKAVSKSERDWNDRMEKALWAYRMTHRTSTRTTPYSLIYGVKVVFPIERQIPSLRLGVQEARLSRAFNKKVLLRSFQVGDQVLAIRRPIITSCKSREKFTSKWDGPYVLQEAYSSGDYKIVDADDMIIGPINGKFLKSHEDEEAPTFLSPNQQKTKKKYAARIILPISTFDSNIHYDWIKEDGTSSSVYIESLRVFFSRAQTTCDLEAPISRYDIFTESAQSCEISMLDALIRFEKLIPSNPEGGWR
ncbi:uncharacterized protein [Nicotiana sylvestris]|uniref:uncharacterized protein n=1 Tax=Nicotiana sylvestris TaxID=4096 RepID=UPI00388C8C49